MQININKINYYICFIIIIISIISCSTFQSLQPIQQIEYGNLDIIKFDKVNHLTFSGISITIPEDWMFLPPIEDNKIQEVYRFISPDGNTTGVMQLIKEEPFVDDKTQDNGKNNNDGLNDNNKNDSSEPNENNENNNTNNEISSQDNNINNNKNDGNNESDQKINTNNDTNSNNQTNNNDEDEKKIKSLNVYLENLLEEKSNYRYAWYLKRYDDRAKGYLSKLIDTKADFVYYALFIDERNPRRLYKLIMVDKNLTPPVGSNPHLNVSQDKVEEINQEILSIFSSIGFTEDSKLLRKQRYDIGIKLEKSDWIPYFDDTINNVFYLEHNLQMALVQMKNLGYKYSDDKDYVIQSIIENFKFNNPVTSESDKDNEDTNNNNKGENEEPNEEEPNFIVENIKIDGIDAYSLTANQYTNPNFQDAKLKIKKIFLVIRDEIYEIALLYDGTVEDLEKQINEVIKNVYVKK